MTTRYAVWIAIALPATLSAVASADTTTLSGVYNEAQARRGADLYALHCALCHGASLSGSYEFPSLTGGFVARWAGTPLDRLVDYVNRAMPLHQPGALSSAESVDLVAFILEKNRFPSGTGELSTDANSLGHIQFRAP